MVSYGKRCGFRGQVPECNSLAPFVTTRTETLALGKLLRLSVLCASGSSSVRWGYLAPQKDGEHPVGKQIPTKHSGQSLARGKCPQKESHGSGGDGNADNRARLPANPFSGKAEAQRSTSHASKGSTKATC